MALTLRERVAASASDRWWLLAAALAWTGAVASLIPLGYGNDHDTFRMLATWQAMVHDGTYVASRFTGYPVAEFAIGLAAATGGAWLSNLLVALSAAGTLVLTWRLLALLDVRRPGLVLAVTLANPWIMIQSGTSMDYMIAWFFLAAGMVMCLSGRQLVGVVLLAVSVGTRMPMLVYAALFLWLFTRHRPQLELRFLECIVGLIFVSGLFYLPVWIAHHLEFEWLSAAWLDQGLWGNVARFIVKVPKLFGLVPSCVALALALVAWRHGMFEPKRRRNLAVSLSLAMCGATLVIYLRLPADVSYCVYMVPFIGILLTETGAVTALCALIAGSMATAFVDIDPIRVTDRIVVGCDGHATGARVDPHLVAGPLLAQWRDPKLGERCYKDFLLVPFANANAPLP